MHQLDEAILYDWNVAGRRLRLWKRVGESYEHVMMKALGFAMFVGEYPQMLIEEPVGLRYKPDLVARDEVGHFRFWGECGAVSVRKIAWLLKHTRAERFAIFKLSNFGAAQLAKELRAEVEPRYLRRERVVIISFVPDIIERTAERRVAHVPLDWYSEICV